LGWLLVNEKFFAGIGETLKISNLKFRGSYGSLGNQVIIDKDDNQVYYPYIPSMTSDKIKQVLDNDRPLAVYQPGVVSPSLTWERVRTINGGVDLGLFNGKLDVSFDIYTRYTEGMLTGSKELPDVFGADEPRTNAADLKTQGWELSLGWRDRFTLAASPFNWSVKVMLADSKSYITKFDNPSKLLSTSSYYEGQRIGEIWGFTNDGFFQTEEELAQLDQSAVGEDDNSYKFYVGDTRFKDLNGDKKIDFGDKTVDNPGDRKIIGNSEIRLPYSFELAADWKSFDLRAFFQGVGKRDWYPGAASVYFWGVYAQPWTNVTKKNLDRWTPEKPDGYFPRMKAYIAEDPDHELGAAQTKYLQDASYLRLKNLTVGYTLPKNISDKMKIEHLRLYFSAENVFTISHMEEGIGLDPELVSGYNGFNSGVYPMQRTYSLGLNLTF
jgi:TonB-linked SusC/RagA family outer membrane protein